MYNKEKVIHLILEKKYYEARDYCEDCLKQVLDRSLVLFMFMLQIAIKESENGEIVFFDISDEPFIWGQHYHNLKFLVRRLEVDRLYKYREKIIDYIDKYPTSNTAISTIISSSTLNPVHVLNIYQNLKK